MAKDTLSSCFDFNQCHYASKVQAWVKLRHRGKSTPRGSFTPADSTDQRNTF
jgi:hypothetical protein